MKRTRLEQHDIDVTQAVQEAAETLKLNEAQVNYVRELIKSNWMSGWYRGSYDEGMNRDSVQGKTAPIPRGSN